MPKRLILKHKAILLKLVLRTLPHRATLILLKLTLLLLLKRSNQQLLPNKTHKLKLLNPKLKQARHRTTMTTR